jgi:hypothetical protein
MNGCFFLGGNVYGNIAMYLVAFGGLYIIIDSFFEFTFHSGIGIATLLVGLLVFAIGLITILHNFWHDSLQHPVCRPDDRVEHPLHP